MSWRNFFKTTSDIHTGDIVRILTGGSFSFSVYKVKVIEGDEAILQYWSEDMNNKHVKKLKITLPDKRVKIKDLIKQ